MKTIRLILLTLLFLTATVVPTSAQQLFKDVPKDVNISYVYISKAALQLGMGSGSLSSAASDIGSCVSNPEGLEVISAESVWASEKVARYISEQMKSLDFQLILSTEEGEESCSIYVKDIKDGKIAKGVLIINTEVNEYNVVYFKGDIDIACLSEN